MDSQPNYVATETRRDGEGRPRVPRWVKVSGLVIGALLLVLVAVSLLGVAGEHGPGRHVPGMPIPSASSTSGGSSGHDSSKWTHP